MLTGRRMFTGETASDVLASVIKDEPNWKRLPHGTPEAVRLLLERCLLRDVRDRLRDIGEARFTLNQPLLEPSTAVSRRSRWLEKSAILALILAVAGISFRAFRGTAGSPQKTATVHPITANPIEFAVTGTAISPDGEYVAIADARGLSLRLLATGETHRVDLGPEFRLYDAWWFPNRPRLLLLGGITDGSPRAVDSAAIRRHTPGRSETMSLPQRSRPTVTASPSSARPAMQAQPGATSG